MKQSIRALMCTLLYIFSTNAFSFDREWLNSNENQLYPTSYNEEKAIRHNQKKLGFKFVQINYETTSSIFLRNLDNHLKGAETCDYQFIVSEIETLKEQALSKIQIKAFFRQHFLERKIDSVLLTIINKNIDLYTQFQKNIPNAKSFKKYNDEKILNLFKGIPDDSICAQLDGTNKVLKKYNTTANKNKHFVKFARAAFFNKLISSKLYKTIVASESSHYFKNYKTLNEYQIAFNKTKGSFRDFRKEAINNYAEKLDQAYPANVPKQCQVTRPERLGPVLYEENIKLNTKKFILKKQKDLTRRSALYLKFSSDQIKELANVILQTSRRIESACVYIVTDFDLFAENDEEILVLEPQAKYNYALKQLERDFFRLEKTFALQGLNITYEDVVMASYEVGLIHITELNQVIKFENFWNVMMPKWKVWASFATSIGSTASLALPPPLNFIAASGLTIINSAFFKQQNNNKREGNHEAIF